MLYREDMDRMTCSVPGCDHKRHEGLFLHSKCHTDTPLWAEYVNGMIKITCAECGNLVGEIAVSRRIRKSH